MKMATIAKRAADLADALWAMTPSEAAAVACRTRDADGPYGDAARALRRLSVQLDTTLPDLMDESDAEGPRA